MFPSHLETISLSSMKIVGLIAISIMPSVSQITDEHLAEYFPLSSLSKSSISRICFLPPSSILIDLFRFSFSISPSNRQMMSVFGLLSSHTSLTEVPGLKLVLYNPRTNRNGAKVTLSLAEVSLPLH